MPTHPPTLLLAILAALVGCEPEPAPLPAAVAAPAEARRVRVPGVDGYLARPAGERLIRPASLLLFDDLGAASQAATRLVAEGGRVALAIGPDSDDERARAYLEGMPDTSTVAIECRAPRCQ